MRKFELQREISELDMKVAEIQVETGDHARDVAQRLDSVRDQLADIRDQVKGLPDDQTGRALRAAVPDIIALQAVRFALDELDLLDPCERSLGIDRARILIERHSGRLHELFGEPMDPRIRSVIDEASEALGRAAPTS